MGRNGMARGIADSWRTPWQALMLHLAAMAHQWRDTTTSRLLRDGKSLKHWRKNILCVCVLWSKLAYMSLLGLGAWISLIPSSQTLHLIWSGACLTQPPKTQFAPFGVCFGPMQPSSLSVGEFIPGLTSRIFNEERFHSVQCCLTHVEDVLSPDENQWRTSYQQRFLTGQRETIERNSRHTVLSAELCRRFRKLIIKEHVHI